MACIWDEVQFRAGNLSARIDVMLYGHVDLELAEQIEGLPKAWSPMPFTKTAQTPSFGTPCAKAGIAALHITNRIPPTTLRTERFMDTSN